MQIVSEVMTRNVQFVSPQETVQRAAQMMDELNVGSLPVCEGERLVGMVTDRDITVRATAAGLAPGDAVVDEVMSTDVRWCFEDQSLDDVMRHMADTQIRRVPVVSHDGAHKLVGIVSLGDLATKSGAGARKEEIEQVVEKVSFPSEPDRSPQGGSAGAAGTSDAALTCGLAGPDELDRHIGPGIENFSTADPSDVVEVTPDELVNRNAPGSLLMKPPAKAGAGTKPGREDGATVRHIIGSGEPASGAGGAPAIDGADASDSSGTGIGGQA